MLNLHIKSLPNKNQIRGFYWGPRNGFMQPWLKPHSSGSLLLLYIQPGASVTEVQGEHDGRLKVKIKAPPRDGEANEAVVEYFSKILKLPKKKIFLIRGESSRQKDLLVELSTDKVTILLQELFE